jgi:hypothetical protein
MQSSLESRWRSGAVWFYYTAVLAIAATILRSSGQAWGAFLGLGVLQSPLTARFAGGEKIALVASAVTVLVLLGWFAGLGKTWAFGIGMLAYAADAVLLALTAQWFAIAVHVVVLVFLYGGLTAAGMAVENEKLTRDMAIRAALAKDRAQRPVRSEEPLRPSSSDPLAAPQAFRPGATPPPQDEKE